jgi:hypothetical protein
VPHRPAIRKGVSTDFVSDQALFKHQEFAGTSKCIVFHRIAYSGKRVVARIRYDYAFAQGKAIRLHYQLTIVLLNEFSSCGSVIEHVEGCGRNSVFRHHRLGECFRPLDLGGGPAGAEGSDSFDRQPVDQSGS